MQKGDSCSAGVKVSEHKSYRNLELLKIMAEKLGCSKSKLVGVVRHLWRPNATCLEPSDHYDKCMKGDKDYWAEIVAVWNRDRWKILDTYDGAYSKPWWL